MFASQLVQMLLPDPSVMTSASKKFAVQAGNPIHKEADSSEGEYCPDDVMHAHALRIAYAARLRNVAGGLDG